MIHDRPFVTMHQNIIKNLIILIDLLSKTFSHTKTNNCLDHERTQRVTFTSPQNCIERYKSQN